MSDPLQGLRGFIGKTCNIITLGPREAVEKFCGNIDTEPDLEPWTHKGIHYYAESLSTKDSKFIHGKVFVALSSRQPLTIKV